MTHNRFDGGLDVHVFSADLVLPVTAPPVLNGAIAVAGGHILHVGTRTWVVDSLHRSGRDFTERYWSGVITPGLVNAHSHLQYTGMAEIGRGQYHGFDSWAAVFNEAYDKQHDWQSYAAEGTQRMIATGTTSVADIVTDMEAISVLHDAGLHGITYWEVMGWNNERWLVEGRDHVLAELSQIPLPPAAGLSPHAPYSLDTEPLLDLPDIVRQRGLRLHTHLGEAPSESEYVRDGSGALADLWRETGAASFRVLREHGFGMSSAEFIDHLGVLGPDCHVAHGVYLSAKDRQLLRLRGTSVALCPRSNAVIGLDEAPVAAYLSEGNQLAVGTDSLSSSPSLDLMADVAELYRLARSQGYTADDLHSRLFAAATLGGAVAMGTHIGPDRVGQLSVGAMADLAFFQIPVSVGSATAVSDALADVVEHGEARVAAAAISGRLRHQDGDDLFAG